jgi:hypothetical protein
MAKSETWREVLKEDREAAKKRKKNRRYRTLLGSKFGAASAASQYGEDELRVWAELNGLAVTPKRIFKRQVS